MSSVQLGLRENRKQFWLLVLVNAFVGGMVGMERSLLPQIAEQEFHIEAKTAILSFIIVFGISKAISNYFTGSLAGKFGRRNLLILGWVLGLPVPFMLMFAPGWNWIVAANVLLGIHQGFAWSSTVVMKIDLVGEKNRGLAMGLNEFAGYIAVALVALLTGWLAEEYDLRPYPFYTGVLLTVAGLLFTVFFIKDTRHHVSHEAGASEVPRLKNIFLETSLLNRNLGSVTQAGLINNLNDGMVWGLFPILLSQKNFNLADTGIIIAIYPAVWGIGQLVTGKMSDYICKKSMLFWGMMLQGAALLLFVFAEKFWHFATLSVLLGWGTALVYPTFLATVAENTHPHDRAKSLGVFRFWRDMGYAFGALLTGLLADALNISASMAAIAGLTILSALIIQYRMSCKIKAIKISAWLVKSFRQKKEVENSTPI